MNVGGAKHGVSAPGICRHKWRTIQFHHRSKSHHLKDIWITERRSKAEISLTLYHKVSYARYQNQFREIQRNNDTHTLWKSPYVGKIEGVVQAWCDNIPMKRRAFVTLRPRIHARGRVKTRRRMGKMRTDRCSPVHSCLKFSAVLRSYISWRSRPTGHYLLWYNVAE